MSLIAITWSTNNPISAFCPYNTIMLPLKTQQDKGLYRDVSNWFKWYISIGFSRVGEIMQIYMQPTCPDSMRRLLKKKCILHTGPTQ
jgi:hypothetical protein